MKKTTDKNIYLAIDERIDRVVEQFDNKIDDLNKYGFNNKDIKHLMDKIDDLKFLIKFNYDESFQSNTQLKSEIDDLRQQIDYFEQKTPSNNKKYIHYKWEKNLDMNELREEMCLIMNDAYKGLNLHNQPNSEPCDCICESGVDDKYIKVDDRVIRFIKTAVKEKLNKMEDE